MHQGDPFILCHAWLDPGQLRHRAALFQLLHDRAQPVRRLGMAHPHVVFEIPRIVDKSGLAHNESREPLEIQREMRHRDVSNQISTQESA